MTLSKVEAELSKRSLAYFVKKAWPILEPTTTYVPGFHIDAICSALEAVTRGEIRNLVINMPPRHMKSLLVSVFWPVWVWLNKPSARWLFSSYAADLSIRDSVKCRRLITHPWFMARFSDCFKLTGDQNQKEKFENDKTGYRIATSVGGRGTGEGGDFIVVDDPHKVGEAESKPVREGVLAWWDEEMSSRGNDPKTVAKVIVMQRVHQADLTGHVLFQGGYDHLCLPAEYDGPRSFLSTGWTDPRKSFGELLWPDRFGYSELKEAKLRLGSRGAAGQLQQRPAAEEGDIIKRAWIQRYQEPPERYEEHLISVDATFTGKSTSDFVAIQVWSRYGARKWLRHRVKKQLGITETIRALLEVTELFPEATLKLIENKANGPALEDLLKLKVSGLVLWEPEGDKVARMNAVAPQFEAGNVFIPADPSYDEYIDELCTFPNAANDDESDATSMALLRLEESVSRGAGVIRVI